MSKPIITLEKVYTDASGAPATVLVDGHYLAADFIGGEVRIYAKCTIGRPPSKRTIGRAKAAYLKHIKGLVNDEWLAANVAMYAKTG